MSIRRGIVAVIVGMLAVVMLVVLTYVLPVFIQLKLTGEKTTQKSIDFPQPRFTPKPSAPDIVIQPFKRTITDEGVDQLQIKAERAEIEQKDKKFKLKNITEAIFYGQDDRNYIVSAKEGIWDQNERFVKIQGDVEIDIISEDDPVDISAEWITYNFPMKILDGGGGIKLRSGPYYSEGDRIAVNMVDDRITLDSRVKTLIEPSAFKKSSLNI